VPAAYADEARVLTSPLRMTVRKHSIRVADCLSAAAATAFVLWAFGRLGDAADAILICALGAAVHHSAGGCSHANLGRSTLDEIPTIVVLAALLTLTLAILYPGGHAHIYGWRAVALWNALVVALAAGRMTARAVAARVIGPERCLVIGTIIEARRIQRRLSASAARVDIIGTVRPSSLGADRSFEELQEALATVVADIHADRVIVAASDREQKHVAQLVRVAQLEGIEMMICSPLLDAAAAGAHLHNMGGMAVLATDAAPCGRVMAMVNRGLDVTFSSLRSRSQRRSSSRSR